jgi:uncharacterized protein (TIGR00266 family)
MTKKNLKEKYKGFAADYKNGMGRSDLCKKYDVPEKAFDDFMKFITKKGLLPSGSEVSGRFRATHDIDFRVFGDDMQFVEIELDPGETAIAEAGAMMYMDAGIEMQTIFGDGSEESNNLMGKIFGAGKRVLTGESLFMTAFTNTASGKQKVSFGAPYPGKIVSINLAETGGEVLCQKDAFLCAAKGVSIDIAFQKKIGVGLFGGEGFILQKLKGDGYAFAHAGGTVMEKYLEPSEKIKIDTGCIAAMQSTLRYDIELAGGIKTAVFGGEGLFFANVTGPGKVWIQSLPFSRIADRIIASAPKIGGQRKGEGSILGSIGDLLNGDSRF